jgi:hypothetical protein
MDDVSAAWAAGFFEGEGSFRLNNGRTPSLQANQVDREPLERLQRILGGTLNGPYGPYGKNTGGRKPYYYWQVTGEEAKAAMRRMEPYLSVRRLFQWEAILVR